MAGTWTSERFPQFEPAIRKLTQQHLELKVEPLHLRAVSAISKENGGRKTLRLVHWAVTFATGKLMLPEPPPASMRMLASSTDPSVMPALLQALK